MSDNDMIRRGDALRVADEVFDQCENVNGDDRGAFAAAEVGARIAALPAVTVGVKPLVWQPTIDSAGNPHRVTVAYCPVFERRFFAEEPEDQPRIEAKRAARILAGLEPAPTDAAQAEDFYPYDGPEQCERDLEDTAAQAREAALLEALQWCSGSDDFQKGGKAREGWLRVCAPLLIGEART